MRIRTFVASSALAAAIAFAGAVRGEEGGGGFAKGPPDRPDFFPIAVWLQDVANAPKYRDVGVNVYVGLWRGPTAEQLDALDAAGIRAIVRQSPASLKFRDRSTIIGWMHDDEPDNAQPLKRGQGEGYGPPVLPSAIVDGYREMKAADPDRPILLNLGQGVAWDGWYGRGVRTNHPEDYPEYLEGCDIASFDIYPVSHRDEAVAGKLWYVPRGVARLREWTGGRKPVWCCIETTNIDHEDETRRASPEQIRSEVWMALIRGAKGLIYFAHRFKPTFIEAGLLADDATARAVRDVNRRIHELAPVLHEPDVVDGVQAVLSNEKTPVATLVKRHEGFTYVFSASLREGGTTVEFRLPEHADATVEVLDESRTIEAPGGAWSDDFTGYQVHLYRIGPKK